MNNDGLVIRFRDTDLARANIYAQDLERSLHQVGDLKVRRRKESNETQDFGATLVLILGTTSITTLAGGLAAWLRRNSGAIIELEGPDGRKETIRHVNSSDAAAIIEQLRAPRPKQSS